MSQWLVSRTASMLDDATSRRSFLTKVAVAGSALALAPWRYLLRPDPAYAVVCGQCGGTGLCCDGYTEFCCVLYGDNACPPGSFAGGWWKADGSTFCGGQARYYVDCHNECRRCGCSGGSGFCGQACVDCSCGCASCANRQNCCTNFRYGQCNQDISCVGPIACRVATCSPPYLWDRSCTTLSLTDQRTVTHSAGCLAEPGTTWHSWVAQGGVLRSAPAVASWGVNRLDVFVLGTNSEIWHKFFDYNRWSGWSSLGAPPRAPGGILDPDEEDEEISDPAAVSWGRNRIDLFATGTSGRLWHKWWDGTRWLGWKDLGGDLAGPPAVSSWATNRLDVFAPGAEGDLQHIFWAGSGWSSWESLGGVIEGRPAAVSWGPNRIDVFVRGADDAMWHKWWDGLRWVGWKSLGGVLRSGPAAASWDQHRLDVFVRGTDDALWQRTWDGRQWVPWTPRGGVLRSDPATAGWGGNRIDVFVRGTDDQLWQNWLT